MVVLFPFLGRDRYPFSYAIFRCGEMCPHRPCGSSGVFLNRTGIWY